MISQEEIKKIQETTEAVLQKMTVIDFSCQISPPTQPNSTDAIHLSLTLKDPQVLIGSNGQTLFELERILKIILSRQLKKSLLLYVDINGYKEKKINYLKNFAQDVANEVSFTQKPKSLFPMPSYQRRIIHMELASRQDILTESQGEGSNRHIIVNPLIN